MQPANIREKLPLLSTHGDPGIAGERAVARPERT